MNRRLLFLILLLFPFSGIYAQISGLGSSGEQDPIVTVRTFLSHDKIPQGGEAEIAVKATIANEWHINSHQPSDEFLIPTELSFDSTQGIEINKIRYPLHQMLKFDFSEDKMAVYTGKITLFATLHVAADVPAGEHILRGKLHYQACNNIQCVAPTDVPFELQIPVVQANEQARPINDAIFTGGATSLPSDDQPAAIQSDNKIGAWLQQRGWAITFFLIFLGGLALNLTPCVYPLIPITVGFFVNQAQGKLSRSFVLASFYVLGMAITYSTLGVIAALTGGLLGSALQNPLALIFIAAVLLLLASSMFGAFDIRVPQKLAMLGGSSRQGFLGSLLMGLTVGIVAAPCIGPFVLSLLIFVGEKGNPALGFLMFFTLSLGLGLPFLFLGAFSGSITKLPRSGGWMSWVKKVFGFVLVALAIYFLEPLLPGWLYRAGLVTTAVVGGIYLGWIDKTLTKGDLFPWLKKAVGVLAIVMGALILLPKKEAPAVAWHAYDEQKLTHSISNGQPVMIDFYADWCLPCKELDKQTFTDAKVITLSEEFLPLKADLTKENSSEVRELREKYNILGVPTIVFVDASGIERKELRITGYVEPEQFANLMNKVLMN